MADGKLFAHPLHHLRKTEKDLPVVVIDSFQHMYAFPDFANIRFYFCFIFCLIFLSRKSAMLRQFVEDLFSGKLHREFHQGSDSLPTQSNVKYPMTIFF